jgi:UDP-glucuronate 4-epimerase
LAVILVTGAAGFIGSHVTERLLGRGDTVVGFDNFDPFYPRAAKERNLAEARRHPAFVFIEGDLRDPATVAGVLEQHRPDRIVHLAAKAGVRPSIDDPVAYVETNITGTLNLLCACRRFPVEHFVFASSSSVYGEAEKVPFSETDATDSPASPYAATKKAGETLCFTYHRLLRMPVTCLRFFNVFGPRQRPDLAVSKFVPLIDAGKPVPFFGDGSTSRDYTFVGDTLEGIVAALDHPSGYEVYNLGRSNPVSLREMVEGIERVLGKKAVIDPLPEQAVDVRITFADVTRARERLGYEPRVGFEEGVRRYVAWWRDSGG